MKRLYVWEWIVVLISSTAYFMSLYHGFTQQEAIVMVALINLAMAFVAIFCIDSTIVAMMSFAAISLVGLMSLNVPVIPVSVLLVGLIFGAVLLSVRHITDSNEDIDYCKFFGSLAFEFIIIFVVLKYGYLLWNYWQKF